MKFARLAALAGSLAAVFAVALSGASMASASVRPNLTPPCSHGALAGSCGDQVSSSTPPLGLALPTLKATQNEALTGKSNLSDGRTDWFWHNSASGYKVANYAPGAVRSNFCMAQTGEGSAIVVRICNGRLYQDWFFSDSGSDAPGTFTGTWTNVATGDSIAVTTQAGPVVPMTIIDPSTAPLKAQFTFRTMLVAQ
jgi:hypothetical protein